MRTVKLLQQKINYRLMLNNALLEVLHLIQNKKFRDAEIKLRNYHTVLKPRYVQFLATAG